MMLEINMVLKAKEFYKVFLISTLLVLTVGCSNKRDINEYSEQLQINFPKNITLVHYNFDSDFQDYSIQSIYELSYNEKNALLEEIFEDVCDSSDEELKPNSCWQKCDDYYSFKYSNDIGVEINVVFVAKDNFSTLNIYEVKF